MYGVTSFEVPRVVDGSFETFRAEWWMSHLCLKSEKHVACPLESLAKVLTFSMKQYGKYPHPGFTVTYKHFASPEIIRLSPFFDADAGNGEFLSKHWQSPSSLLPLNSPRLRASDESLHTFLPSISTSAEPYSPTSWIVVDLPTSIPATPDTTISGFHPTATRSETVHTSGQAFDGSSSEQPQSTPSTTSHTRLQVQSNSFTSPGRLLEAAHFIAKSLVRNTKSKVMGAHSYITSSQLSMHQVAKSLTLSDPTSPESSSLSGLEFDHTDTNPSTLSLLSSDSLLEASSSHPTSQHPELPNARAMCALKLAPLVFILLCLAGGILKHIARNPRRRADWLARREECRNRQLYARAARYQKLRNWFQRLRGGRGQHNVKATAAPWQEKELPSAQTDISRVDMEAEIRAMRQAHNFVDNIVKAEEGRGREGPQILDYREWEGWEGGWRTRASRSNSDVTGPPPYDEEDVPFAEWFRYTQSGMRVGVDDNTPDSSVIDTSSRDSDCEKD